MPGFSLESSLSEVENPDRPRFLREKRTGENNHTKKSLEVYNFSTLTLYTQINCALFATPLDYTFNRYNQILKLREIVDR